MAKRRYVVSGEFGIQDPDGTVQGPGEVVTLEEKDPQTEGFIANGLIELEKDAEAEAPAKMPCPLCEEKGLKTVPEFESWDELQAHYTDRHPGFVVPAWKGGSS